MSIACGLAWNIQIMILFRALQGAAGASMIPLVFTTAFIYYQGKELGLAAAVVSALASLSPTLGPTLGGWITDNLDWRWLFYINILPGIYLVLSIPFLVNFDKPDLSLLKVADYPSIILLAMTLGLSLIHIFEEVGASGHQRYGIKGAASQMWGVRGMCCDPFKAQIGRASCRERV